MLSFARGCVDRLCGLLIVAAVVTGAGAQAPQTPSHTAPATSKLSAKKHYAFDVVSIRPVKDDGQWTFTWGAPDEYRARDRPLETSIMLAYFPIASFLGFRRERIEGAPDWVRKDSYDFHAKVGADDQPLWQTKGPEKEQMLHEMLQRALQERCNLLVHHTTHMEPAFALVMEKKGAQVTKSIADAPPPARSIPMMTGGRMVPMYPGTGPKVMFFHATMQNLVAFISIGAARPIVDRTGLAGEYDFDLWKLQAAEEQNGSDPDLPSEWDLGRLGLKLVPVNAPFDAIVIDHIERPSEN